MNHQYEVVIVNLDPTIGSEIKKTRPCVIISPKELNDNLKTVVTAPVTSTSKGYPTRVNIQINGKKSWVALDQIRTIDKRRINQTVATLKTSEIVKIKDVIKETFVD